MLQGLQCTDTDCGDCSWRWQWFALGKDGCLFFCDQMRCSHKYVGLNKIVYRACETMHLISVLISVFRDVHNVTFNSLQTKKITASCRDKGSCFWQDLCIFSWSPLREIRKSTHSVKGNNILLSKGHYVLRPFSIALVKSRDWFWLWQCFRGGRSWNAFVFVPETYCYFILCCI